MNRTEAKKVAKYLFDHGYYGLEIVETFPESSFIVTGYNRCGSRRIHPSMEDAKRCLSE